MAIHTCRIENREKKKMCRCTYRIKYMHMDILHESYKLQKVWKLRWSAGEKYIHCEENNKIKFHENFYKYLTRFTGWKLFSFLLI